VTFKMCFILWSDAGPDLTLVFCLLNSLTLRHSSKRYIYSIIVAPVKAKNYITYSIHTQN